MTSTERSSGGALAARALLTAGWLVVAWIFLRYWDLTVRVEWLLLWTAAFTVVYVAASFAGRAGGLDSAKAPWGAAGAWMGMAVAGSAAGLLFPVVAMRSVEVQTVAFLRVLDLILPLWILLRGVAAAWSGRAAVGVTAAVPVVLLAMLWWLMVRMPGGAHEGPPPPATAEELELAERLRGHVVALADGIGSRGSRRPAEARRAAAYIRTELEGHGYRPVELPFEIDGERHVNLEASVAGTGVGTLVVGAHYDTHDLTPGADDNASGVAGVLELARTMAGARPELTVRFVFFATEEPPYFNTRDMGSRVYAASARAAGDEIVLMISLETIGYYTNEPGTQRYPPPFSLFYPDAGDFIGIIGNPATGDLTRRALTTFRASTAFPSEGAVLSSLVPGAELSDHASFWKEGFRAIMITDTAPFRNRNYHEPTDVPSTLDYERMARVVIGVREIVRDFAGG